MLVIGTKPEYLNAVWVKNEWSRFIAMMKKDRKRVLLPCYRGMDPYDMPEALSVLQSYDMAKIGFIQDLIRGIGKIVAVDEPKAAFKETIVVQQGNNTNIVPLLKRAFMFLEDGEWDSADEYSEKVLDIDPECAEAYLVKLMIELKCSSKEKLTNCKEPFNQGANYKKILKFGNQDLINELNGYVDYITSRNETERKTEIYNDACNKMKSAVNEEQFKGVARLFDSISGFKDSDELKKECIEKGKDCVYTEACDIMKSATTEEQFRKAVEIFRRVSGYKDSDEMTEICIEKAEETRKEETYKLATAHSSLEDIEVLDKAIKEFRSIRGYKDSDELAELCLKKAEEARIKERIINKILEEKYSKQDLINSNTNIIEDIKKDTQEKRALHEHCSNRLRAYTVTRSILSILFLLSVTLIFAYGNSSAVIALVLFVLLLIVAPLIFLFLQAKSNKRTIKETDNSIESNNKTIDRLNKENGVIKKEIEKLNEEIKKIKANRNIHQ